MNDQPSWNFAISQMAASGLAELLLGMLRIQVKRGDIDQHVAPMLDAITHHVVGSKDKMESVVIARLGRLAQACEWTLEESEYGAIWKTCGDDFVFIDDGPAENNFKFCPHCGRVLRVAQIERESASAAEGQGQP